MRGRDHRMTDHRRPIGTQARLAGQALDIAFLRLDRLRADDRLEAQRLDVDRHLHVHAVAMLRLLSKMYGSVVLDDEPALISAYTAELDDEEIER